MGKSHGVEVFVHPDDLPPDVQALFSETESDNFEFGVSWFRNLVEGAFAQHIGIRICVLRLDGRPVAALPLITQTPARGLSAESLASYYRSEERRVGKEC